MQLRKVEVTHEIQRGQGAGGLFYREDVRTLLPRLLKEYAGKVQLIYLDPPFQTGHTFPCGSGWAKRNGKAATAP